MQQIFRTLALALAMLAFAAGWANAQQGLTIDIFGPGQAKANLLLSRPLGEAAADRVPVLSSDLQERIHRNLRYMPFLRDMPASDIIGGDAVPTPKAPGIDFKKFAMARTDYLVTSGWRETSGGSGQVNLRVYEVYSGNFLFGQEYTEAKSGNLQEIADRFCSKLMEVLTGRKGFFESKLAFARKEGAGKEIWISGPTGSGARRVTSAGGINTSPSWSTDGSRIAFAHIGDKGHALGVHSLGTGRTDLYPVAGGVLIGPCFLPGGGVAATVEVNGQQGIYQLDGPSFKPGRPLATSWGIDVSPCFDKSGQRMAFASGRQGGPQIFVMDVGSGQVTRVTFEGKYNTSPSLSPDGKLLAYSRDSSEGHRIYVHDMVSGAEKQVSFGPGFDQEPSFDPTGYYIAFSSNRTGTYRLYLTTVHGDEAIPLDTGAGEARSPDWAPAN